MSAHRPHLLHVTLGSEGFWDAYRLECPYDPDDAAKPCAMVDIDKPDRPPVPGCAGIDWLGALGMEILTTKGIVDPQFPIPVDVTWHSGGDHLTLDARPTANDPEGTGFTTVEVER